ncbi:peptidylprolyl isomerase [Magnetospirillum sp. UT-4]|uniref:peptidylprolyl isomerase n=1 Tax=Magnetospirillum sp. UT-4 TaxID=2681467 RepID=UPI00137ECA90|nr:peptidylprolyl isomerase [Magnetospirillum sp. UT-4]CAA7614657.1 PpiC-type peptidyl-prolyl cis-trans isomerase [Magnetospirillum sp. UT-4]
MTFRLAAAFCLALACLAPLAAAAQDFDRVAAVVNDEAISLKDVEARVRMAIVTSRIPDNPEVRRQVVPQVVRKMIDERLQMQEAKRLKVVLASAEIESGIAMLEKQNNMPKGALIGSLVRIGIAPEVVREQIAADLTWLRLTRRILQPQIRIGEEEINDRLEALRERQGQPEYLAAEIFLPVDNPAQEDEVRKTGEDLLAQMRNGAPFPAVARQFSRSPTAANGGSMGWVGAGMVEPELLDELARLGKDQVSSLLRTPSGYFIVAKVNQRIAGTVASPEDAEVAVARIVLPVPTKGAPPKPQLLAQAAELTRPAKTCDDLQAIGQRVGAKSDKVGPMRAGDLPDDLDAAMVLPPNIVSQPADTADGIRVFMVCSRQEGSITAPSREAVRRQIENERLDMLARRYIRDLRRSAFIDIRI